MDNAVSSLMTAPIDVGNIDSVYRDVYLDRARTQLAPLLPVEQLAYLADAKGAGLAIGARVPIVLTSRADTILARIASCAVALVAAPRDRLAVP